MARLEDFDETGHGWKVTDAPDDLGAESRTSGMVDQMKQDLGAWRETVKVTLNEKGGFYSVTGDSRVLEYDKLKRVTSILNSINKPFLMPWAANQTARYINEKMATTGDQNFIQKSVLSKIITEAPKAYRRTSGIAASFGTDAHKWMQRISDVGIANWVANSSLLAPLPEQFRPVVDQWLSWMGNSGLEVIGTEVSVYSPFSDHHQPQHYGSVTALGGFAGTIDCIAIDPDHPENGVALIDYKTGSRIYPEAALQMTAYRRAFIYSGLMHLLDMGEDIPLRCFVVRVPRVSTESVDVLEVAHNRWNEDAFDGAVSITKWQERKEGIWQE
ncbi:hypothetical protein [uncultured Mediterranean phage uvDeep-CGR0-AD1-C239]|nr:hypothetical protein [uncultured Mediterranean phage uvDeep-CGR0-AD1-C239]